MKKIFYILLLLSLLFMIGCNKKLDREQKESEVNSPDYNEEDEEINKVSSIKSLIEEMTLEEKIGQLFIFGFIGQEINSNIENLIEKYKISGVILFNRNIGSKDDTKELIDDLKITNSKNKVPIFISIDEEGGRVSRLNHLFASIPSASEIAQMDSIEDTLKYGKEIGSWLLELGFNLDYAPVLDINTNPKNPVIGDRAFGNTPDSVIKHGIEFMKGIENMGIISCVKHFPGHGDTHEDSHIKLPVVNKTLEELRKLELLPFIKAIEKDTDMIMISHILYPQIDSEYPASMSKLLINNILREDLKFTGVVISDDMTMGGISENYELEDAIFKFFKSGGDLALICHEVEKHIELIEATKNAVESGMLTIDEVDEKLYRILSLKQKYFHE